MKRMNFWIRFSALLVGLWSSVGGALAAEAPKLSLSQVGLHFICTADGQPDMYSWRLPVKDARPGAQSMDYVIPEIPDADLESNSVGSTPVVSGGRTALKVNPTPSAIGDSRYTSQSAAGFNGTDARLVNLDAVHWQLAGDAAGQIKSRYYSNYPPLRTPDQAGRYGTMAIDGPAGSANYGRYYKRHPGYDWQNWNWSLDFDTPLNVNQKRIQGRLHLELHRPATTDPEAGFDYTLVISSPDISSIRVVDRAVFSSFDEVMLKVDRSHFSPGGYASPRKLVEGRRAGPRSNLPEDIGYSIEAEGSVLNLDLLSSFFTVNRDELLTLSSETITVRVYNTHDVQPGTTLQPVQTIQFRLPVGQAPAPDLIVRGSSPVNYIQPDGLLYNHPAVQAPHWWIFHRDGVLARQNDLMQINPALLLTGTQTYHETRGRLHDWTGVTITGSGLSAYDSRLQHPSESQRVPGARALMYGADSWFYNSVKLIPAGELAADSLKRIGYAAPNYNEPLHDGTDTLRVLYNTAPTTPKANVVIQDFTPQSGYDDPALHLPDGFADELPVILGQPVASLTSSGGIANLSITGLATTSPATFQWRFKGQPIPGATGSLYRLPVTSAAAAGPYDVVVTNGKGSVISTPTLLTIADPAIFSHPQPVSAHVGGKVTFSVTAQGSGLKYQWRRNEQPIAKATSRVLTLTNVQPESEGEYDVVVTGSKGSITSVKAGLEVSFPLVVIQQPVGGKVRVGGEFILQVKAAGEPPVQYMWRRNGQPVPGGFYDRLVVSGGAPGDLAGSYDVVISNDHDSIVSAAAQVVEVGLPPQISEQPQPVQADPGADVSFTCQAIGEGTLQYQWRRNQVNLVSGKTSTLNLKAVKKTDEGLYDCVVSNLNGRLISQAAPLQVGALFTFNEMPQDVMVDAGEDVIFGASAGDPGDSVTYQWSFNGKPIPGAVQATLEITQVTAAKAGVYGVTATRGTEKLTALGRLSLNDPGLLVYKLTATGQTAQTTGLVTRRALTGYLVVSLRPSDPGARLLLIDKDGKYERLQIQPLENFTAHSTGPGVGELTVFKNLADQDSFAFLWLQGVESLTKLSAMDQVLAPKTLAGRVNQISPPSMDNVTRIENIEVKAVLEIPHTTLARQNTESLAQVVERLKLELSQKGVFETESAQ